MKLLSPQKLATVQACAVPNCSTPSPVKRLWINHAHRFLSFDGEMSFSCVAVILQGEVAVCMEQTWHHIGVGDVLFVPIRLPVMANFAPKNPDDVFLAIVIELNETLLAKMLHHIKPVAKHNKTLLCGLDGQIDDCVGRMIALFEQENAEFLADLYYQECLYLLLNSPLGASIRQLANPNSPLAKIKKACAFIERHFNQPFKVADLARQVHWGETQFYRHFKEMTSLSPIAYQKSIHLNHAKKLIENKNLPISQIAYDVGYESVSQFSREYKRMFGVSPRMG